MVARVGFLGCGGGREVIGRRIVEWSAFFRLAGGRVACVGRRGLRFGAGGGV